MSHYKTLGVEPNATPEQIKAAYRKLAQRYHPDKNRGEAEAGAKAMFQEVQAAYDVLSDAERRARYDATGTDKAPPTLEEQGREMLLRVFNEVINGDDDPLEHAARILRNAHAQMTAERASVQRVVTRLERRSGKFKRRDGGENLAQMLIDQQLRNGTDKLREIDQALAMRDAAAKLLEGFEFERPAQQPAQGGPTWLAMGFDPIGRPDGSIRTGGL